MNIGQRIKQQRERLGLSQEELAQKLGYKSRSTINKIESGVNDITQSKVVAFAHVLKTTPAALMGWEEIESELEEKNTPADNELDEDLKQIEALLKQLDSENLDKAIDYIDLLLNSQEKE